MIQRAGVEHPCAAATGNWCRKHMSMRSHLWARRTWIYDRNDILEVHCVLRSIRQRMINFQLTCSSPWLVLRMASNAYFLGGEFEGTVLRTPAAWDRRMSWRCGLGTWRTPGGFL